jgi:membrane protein DedA with SNARE-associated domain
LEEFILITSDSAPILAYLGIFTVLLLCGLGLPVPEETVLIAGGYLASSGTIGGYPALGVCFAGVIAGDFLLFTVGRRWGSAGLTSRFLQRALSPRRRVRIRRYFRRHGDKTIFTARFISGFRVAAFLTAGMARMRSRTFLAWDILAALISVPLFFVIGYFLHDQRDLIIGTLRGLQRGLLLLAVAALVGVLLYRRRKRRASPGIDD